MKNINGYIVPDPDTLAQTTCSSVVINRDIIGESIYQKKLFWVSFEGTNEIYYLYVSGICNTDIEDKYLIFGKYATQDEVDESGNYVKSYSFLKNVMTKDFIGFFEDDFFPKQLQIELNPKKG